MKGKAMLISDHAKVKGLIHDSTFGIAQLSMGKFDNFDVSKIEDKTDRPRMNISKSNTRVRMTLSDHGETAKKVQRIFEKLNTRTKNDVYDIVIRDYANAQGVNLDEDAVYIDIGENEPKVKKTFSLNINKKEKLKKIEKRMGIKNTSLTVEWIIENYRKDYDQ